MRVVVVRVWGTRTKVEGGEGVGTRWRRGKICCAEIEAEMAD